MKNGKEYKREIISNDKKETILATINGKTKLVYTNIDSINRNDYQGKYNFDNPTPSKYFITSSAIPIKKGKGYYNNAFLSINSLHYGITDNVSIGGGIELISLIYDNPIWFLNSKIGFQVADKIHIGGSFTLLGITPLRDDFWALEEQRGYMGYGIITFGDTEKSLSISTGFNGGFNSEGSINIPMTTISGIHRLNKSLALLTENIIVSDKSGEFYYSGTHGIRIFSKKNSFNIGLVTAPQATDFTLGIISPYISYSRTF